MGSRKLARSINAQIGAKMDSFDDRNITSEGQYFLGNEANAMRKIEVPTIPVNMRKKTTMELSL